MAKIILIHVGRNGRVTGASTNHSALYGVDIFVDQELGGGGNEICYAEDVILDPEYVDDMTAPFLDENGEPKEKE